MIPIFIRAFACAWTLILPLTACSSFIEDKEYQFRSSEIPCTIRSVPQAADYMRAFERRWDRKLSEDEVNGIASRVMDYANQGDPEAMLTWGAIKLQALHRKLIKNKDDRLSVVSLPEEVRDDLTMAMTYALIVLGMEGEHRATARMMMRTIEHEMEPILLVPSEWVRQAEKNASQWNSYCQRPTPNFDRYVEAFHPEKLSCKSHEISEAREKIEAIKKHPDGDLYFIPHADQIFDDLRKYADEGDAEAMFVIGSLKYEAALIAQIHSLDARRISRPFPDYTKPDLIAAMTYVFASAEMKGKHQKNVHEFVQRLERRSKSNPFIPAAWIEEAKVNVKQWQKLCSGR